MYFALKPNSASESIEILGFALSPNASAPFESTRIGWSSRAIDLFKSISSAAASAGEPAGLKLPYATLRALLVAGLPNPLFVASDLALPSHKSSGTDYPQNFAECDGLAADCQKAANQAVRAWVPTVLSKWADSRGVPGAMIASIADLAIRNELVTAVSHDVDLLATQDGLAPFADMRDITHAALFRALAGKELFPGLGPVRCVVKSRARDNTISFLTFPRAATKGSWSMRARLSVETFPGQRLPFVRLDVSRVRWCPQVPTAFMPRQRRLTATIFGADERRAVSFEVPLHRGKIQDPEDPNYALSALRSGLDVGQSFSSFIAAGPMEGAFVGVPFAPAYEPAPSVATGATELDWLDCYDSILTNMTPLFVPIEGVAVSAQKRVTRKKSDIPAVKAVQILEEVALNLGHNDIDNTAIGDAWQVLHGGELPAGISIGPKAEEARVRFEELRQGNSDRLKQTFGDQTPPIIVLSASAEDGAAIADIVRTLFAGRVTIVNRLLPPGVHGPRKTLPASEAPARDRYEARLQAWKPVAEMLREEFGSSRVLVHARRFQDDVVNKIAGRVALARFGDCNAQYLDGRGHKADEWFFRIQAAVLDLMFGHSGLVSPVAENIEQAFPDPLSRPKSIIGISVVSQTRTYSRSASSFFLSVSIDVASGRTIATAACPKDGDLEFIGPLPFFDLLKAVAGWEGTSVGSTETAKSAFQQFVSEIAGNACDRGQRPLIMIDGAYARNLWHSISNLGWLGPHALTGYPFNPATDWPGARIIRIEDTIEPNVITRKLRSFIAFDAETGVSGREFVNSVPTLTEPGRLVRIAGPAPNYISSGDLDGQQKIAKGLSVFRQAESFKKAPEVATPAELAGWDVYAASPRDLTNEPYKLPGVIGILVAHCLPEDDPDRIAALCHCLRNGFGHTRSPTRLPAPLFHTRKVAEYIPAYVLDGDDHDETVEIEETSEVALDDTVDDPAETFEDERSIAESEANPTVAQPKPYRDLAFSQIASPISLANIAGLKKPVNSLLALVEGPTGPLDRPGRLSPFSLALPIRPGLAQRSNGPTLPGELRARADGDAELEQLFEKYWVGPMPSFMNEEWLVPLFSPLATARARSQIKEKLESANSVFVRLLPELDIDSDGSFARFILGLFCIGDGTNFLRVAIPRQLIKNQKRWIFNSLFDQLFRTARQMRRTESPTNTINAFDSANLALMKQLHEAGHTELVRRFLVLEPLFTLKNSPLFAETATRLQAECGSEYDEVAAFCARLARYYKEQKEVRANLRDYTEKQRSLSAPRKQGRADMQDAVEITELATIPQTPAVGVDASFLRDKISLSGAFRSYLHVHRTLIREALDDETAWPEAKPSAEQITACIARLFSAPVPVLAGIGEREKESLFRPFYRKMEAAVRAIEESRPPNKRMNLFPNWTSAGVAPAVFVFLANNGYRAYANELAIVRAIENPSLALEEAVASKGEEFAETARFVQARRHATLWFAVNDERADNELFSPYLSAFDEGEYTVTTKDAPAEVTENQMNTETVKQPDASPSGHGLEDVISTLGKMVSAITGSAHRSSEAYTTMDYAKLDQLLGELEALAADAREVARSINRKTSNLPWIERASAVRHEVLELVDAVGGEVSISEFPPVGDIDPAIATQATEGLRVAQVEVDEVKRAIGEARQLQIKSSQLKVFESFPVIEEIRHLISQAKERLESLVTVLNHTIASLRPEDQPASTVALDSEVPFGSPEASGTALEDNEVPSVTIPAEQTAGGDPDLTVPPVEIIADHLDLSDPLLDDIAPNGDDEFYISELEEVASFQSTSFAPLADPITNDSPAPGEEIEELDVYEAQDTSRIEHALEAFVAAGSFGLAYHLARASEIEAPERILYTTSTEAKLASLAGHLNHTALQTNVELVQRWVQDAFRAADQIAADTDQERAAARLMALMPLMIELGIFFPSQGAAEFLRKFESLPGDLGTRALRVFDSVSRIQHTNLVFSRAMLANVANELDCSKAIAEVRVDILKRIEMISTAKFDFQLAAKIRNELLKTDNLVGGLRAQLLKGKEDQKSLDVVTAFVDQVRDRARIVQLFDDIEVQINNRYQGLDGVARNRMVTFFEDLRDLASAYMELMSEVEEAKATERPKVREFAKQIAKSLDEMIEAVDASGEDLGRIGQAAKHVSPRLRKVAKILSGETGMSMASSYDIYQACHAELALVPTFEYGRSWLPCPYNATQVIDLLCDISAPLLPADRSDRNEAFEVAVRTRMDRSSYVGAQMLLDAATFFDIDDNLTASLSGDLETGKTAAKESMKSDFDRLRRMVERVVRFGSLRQGHDAEVATAMLDRIENLEAMKVPADVEPGDRTENEVDGVYDVSVAIDEIENIRSEAQQLLDEPRNRLERRIDELAGIGTSQELIDRLRQLCQTDDLLTAEEHIEEVVKTGKISESRRGNGRFRTFTDIVLPALEPNKHDFSHEAAAAIRDGIVYGGMPFDQLSDARRSESAAVIEMWRDLFRRFHDSSFAAHLSTFLEKLGIEAEIDTVPASSGSKHKMFVADFRATIPSDQESLLLPDFGSRTDGMYRMIVSQSMPSDAFLSEHCKVGKLGVILFVSDIVPASQRRSFHLRNLAESRRVLLIDSASLLLAMSEPSIRPLTLIELAQPYSYVAPYNDWGNDAVPQEMFVGREEDLARIADPEGSNIVYGGRRMGKTAIFRHLVTVSHAPQKGMIVAYVDAREIGRGNTATKAVWSNIAGVLPEVFNGLPPSEPRKIREGIERWLLADSRRRILLLLDESDHFIVSDASNDYIEFRELQKLMTVTKRRFKLVLAGLSDVTRLVQTGNPPLKQIAANPRRIGSLTGDERRDAEDLLLRPFAALGLEFERTDVWRVLSYSNYYPVLIQTYAQRILQSVIDRTKATQRPMRNIPPDLVAEVLDDVGTRSEIKKIFEFTLNIDPRYRLIAFVVANLVFQAEAEGRLDEGFALHEIRDNAINFWEAGFQDRNRFSLFEDLLDEMEGLGIVRRVVGDRWTLRSSAVVRLLGNRDEIESAILHFNDHETPVGFDPKSHRRELPAAKNVLNERRSSPLTLGQERDLLLTKARATVIVGNRLSDYPLAAHAVRSVPESFSDGEVFEARVVSAASPQELDAVLRDLKVSAGHKVIAIVPASVPWSSDWIRTAINNKGVARGDIKLAFVGGPDHAASVFGDEKLGALTSHIDIVPLEPWSTAYFNDVVNKNNVVSLHQKFENYIAINGGWNSPMWQMFHGQTKTAEAPDRESLGLNGRYGKAIALVFALHGLAPISGSDVQDYIDLDEELSSLGVTARAVVEYGLALGLLEIVPGKAAGERDRTRYTLSSVAANVLEIERKVAAE